MKLKIHTLAPRELWKIRPFLPPRRFPFPHNAVQACVETDANQAHPRTAPQAQRELALRFSQGSEMSSAGLQTGCPEGIPALRGSAKPRNPANRAVCEKCVSSRFQRGVTEPKNDLGVPQGRRSCSAPVRHLARQIPGPSDTWNDRPKNTNRERFHLLQIITPAWSTIEME